MDTSDEAIDINELLEKYATRVPAKGMHISYLDKACRIMELYGEILSVMEEERTSENRNIVLRLAEKIREIVGQ